MPDEQNLPEEEPSINTAGFTDGNDNPLKEPIPGHPPITNNESQTPETMEVHHHPHLPHGGKRKFKEYFLEFLMIFLAVSLGFLAENVREHYMEHKHARQYAILLMQDIKKNAGKVKEEIERNRYYL